MKIKQLIEKLARLGSKDRSKYKSHLLRRLETLSDKALFNRDKTYGKTLIICEGEADAIALREYRINAVSIPKVKLMR
jgi:hypothetical protein